MDVPLAPRNILKKAIVVYPEVVPGNPLGSRHVVRWFLHKPWFINKNAFYGRDELNFYYQPAFADKSLNINPENQLRLRWIRDDVYRDLGLPGREGTCRLIRKGRLSGLGTDPEDGSILLDNLSHEEKAEVFNRSRIMYSHDPYTMYCFYAALCGCIPVVLPQPGMSREEWQHDEADRYGIAYGEKDIEWAVATRPLLIEKFYREKQEEEEMVVRFLRALAARFL